MAIIKIIVLIKSLVMLYTSQLSELLNSLAAFIKSSGPSVVHFSLKINSKNVIYKNHTTRNNNRFSYLLLNFKSNVHKNPLNVLGVISL